MIRSYTARYTKISSGYMGQLVEWPEVVTEGRDLEDCRAMLRDALEEMVLAHRQLGREVPTGTPHPGWRFADPGLFPSTPSGL